MSITFAAVVLYLIAAACFLLAVFRVNFPAGLTELGLLFVALGLLASAYPLWSRRA